ncbi:MAG: hypothetical protein CSYNP_03650 [Syntrophus sp. SKADARSKE-3]|nr:hypothetical protein [Syntrophus sp. SKADARSKE-3]
MQVNETITIVKSSGRCIHDAAIPEKPGTFAAKTLRMSSLQTFLIPLFVMIGSLNDGIPAAAIIWNVVPRFPKSGKAVSVSAIA